MGSPTADIATTRDLLVTAVNAALATFSPTPPALTAVAIYDISFDLNTLKTPRMIVIPAKKTTEIEYRGNQSDPGPVKSTMTFDVGVQFKYIAPTTTVIDPYMAVMEQIVKYFPTKQLSNGAVCLESEHTTLFYHEHMTDFRVFTSVASLVFRLEP